MKILTLLSKYNYLGTTSLASKRQKEIKISNTIKSKLNTTYLSVIDTTLGNNSCGLAYKIVVQSPQFINLRKVEQHKMVMTAISDDFTQIHSLVLKTRAPDNHQILQVKSQTHLESQLQKDKNQY